MDFWRNTPTVPRGWRYGGSSFPLWKKPHRVSLCSEGGSEKVMKEDSIHDRQCRAARRKSRRVSARERWIRTNEPKLGNLGLGLTCCTLGECLVRTEVYVTKEADSGLQLGLCNVHTRLIFLWFRCCDSRWGGWSRFSVELYACDWFTFLIWTDLAIGVWSVITFC